MGEYRGRYCYCWNHRSRAARAGDIVYVDLPKSRSQACKGATLGSVESVKAVPDVYSPVSGEVIAINESLVSNAPEKLNAEPHDGAWSK